MLENISEYLQILYIIQGHVLNTNDYDLFINVNSPKGHFTTF